MPLRLYVFVLFFAAAVPAHRLPVKVYTTANGLPRNSARCLVPDSNGLLWICTSEGLVRFDGYQFRVFGREHGLPSRSIFDFVVSRKGGYWVVSDAGVCRLPAGSRIGDPCRPLAVDGPTGDFQPDAFVESPDGNTWVATTRALFRVSDDGNRLERTPIEVRPGLDTIENLAVAPDGTLLLGTDLAIYRWRPGRQPLDISAPILPFGATQIVAIPPDAVWVVTPRGLYRLTGWDGGRHPPAIERLDCPAIKNFTRILRRRDGTYWMSGNGISRLQFAPGRKVTEAETYTPREGLPVAEIEWFTEDRQGDLWAATDAAGIFRITQSGFTLYTSEDGLGTARMASVFEDVQGDLCALASPLDQPDATDVYVKIGPTFKPVRYARPPGPFNPGWGWNQFGLQAHDGEWWFPTGSGLLRFAKAAHPQELNGRKPAAIYNQDSPLHGQQVFRVFEDSKGDLWIVTLAAGNQLVTWERSTGHFRRWTSAEGWPDNSVAVVIRESSSGTHWIGTFGELLRFRHGRFETMPVLPSAQIAFVRDLYIDRAGRLWVATARYGLYRCDNPDAAIPVFRNYTTAEGLSSDSTRAITEDDAGFIYVGTVRGVDRIDPRAPAGAYRIRHFTPADGLPDNEQNVAFHDRRGHLWFGSLNGLAEFDPSRAAAIVPPQVYLNRLRVRGEDVPLPWEGARSLRLDLGPDRNQFEIEYAGIDLRSVASLRYQYRLAGLDKGWSQPVENLSVNYASLPAGQFHFEVRAVSADGQTGPVLDGFEFSVAAPVWQRWWFTALAAALTAASVAFLFQYRVRHLLAIERLRTRIATDLHDDIGASLTQISILGELAHRGDSHQVLEDIATIARELVQEMSDIVWAVNPRHDRFDALSHRMRRFANDTLGDIGVEFDAASLPADFSVPLECRRPLYLVFKEAAHNVARHSGASSATIRIELEGDALKLTVRDNGRGFDPSASREGDGMSSIQRRMREIGGDAIWESAPGHGTTLTAVLPLRAGRALPKLRGTFTGTRL